MRFLPLLLGLIGALALAVVATTPPAPLPDSAPAVQFSATRAMRDVRAIAAVPHTSGTPENARVRAYLAQRMAGLGMEVGEQQAPYGDYARKRWTFWTGGDAGAQHLTNVIGVLKGRNPALPAVALMAHHDTVWGSPGAADDTAGVASALEVARALRARGDAQRDVVLVITDAEELGLDGATAFFADHPLRQHIGAVINMEARGGGGRTTMFQTSRDNGAAVALYADAVRRPATSSLAAFVYSVLPNDTDLTPVLKGPWLGYNFAFIGRSGLYHSPKATPDRLDQGALQDMGAQVLDLASGLAQARDLPVRAPDAVFFDAFGLGTVVYPVWLGWAQIALAAAALVWAARRKGWQGAGRMAALMLVAGVMAYGLNRLSLGMGPANYYDRLAAIPRLEGVAGMASLAAFLLVFGCWKGGGKGAATGPAALLLVLGAGMQALAPTAAYVVVVPVLLVALGMATGRVWLQAIIAAVVVGYQLALGHQLMQGVGPTMPMAVALPLAVAAMALLPLWPALPRRVAQTGAILALLCGGGVALWVALDAPADTIAVYSDTKH